MQLESVTIENFKSIRKIVLPVKQLTILLGPNSAGKTNILEFFKFVQIVLSDLSLDKIKDNWWEYSNLTKDYETNKKITGIFRFRLRDHILTFTIKISISGQDLNLEQTVHCENTFFLSKGITSSQIMYNFSSPGLKDAGTGRRISYRNSNMQLSHLRVIKKLGLPLNDPIDIQFTPSFCLFIYFATSSDNQELISISIDNNYHYEIEPKGFEKIIPLIQSSAQDLNHFFARFTFLSQLNFSRIRNPVRASLQSGLNEDGSNILSIIFQWFIKKSDKWNDLLDSIRILYPESDLKFDLTTDGEMFLVLREQNGTELRPPNISDGFFRLLVILTAINTEPSLLLIDEVENSLYQEALELVFDELRSNDLNAILTTHSPVFVDLTDLTNLVLISKPNNETLVFQPKRIKQLKEKLTELKLSHSDAWLFGVLEET